MDRTTKDGFLAALCGHQHGIFSLQQAVDLGFAPGQRARRIRAGRWEQPFAGVYRLAGTPPTWEARLLAACLAGGPRGRASHRSAAARWGLPGASREIVEFTCPRWHRARHDGLVVHESLGFNPADTVVRDAIPVTSVDVTLLDLGAVVAEWTVEQALDAALHRRLTTMSSVQATLERLARRGRDGCGVLRTILERRAPIVGVAESPAETALLRMLLRNGLPAPVLQYEVREAGVLIARVDAAYPEWRIAIEYESYEHHTGKLALDRDTVRERRLLRTGWTVVRVTASDLRTGGLDVAATIRDQIRRAS
jgi:very-short-patch-repair endonuclease